MWERFCDTIKPAKCRMRLDGLELRPVEGIWRYLQAGEAQKENGADADLVDKIEVASLNALPYIVHHMHAQDLHSSGLHPTRQHVELHRK